jgi:hypothetical protein
MTIERPMFPPRAESVDSFSLQPAIEQPAAETAAGDSPKPAQDMAPSATILELRPRAINPPVQSNPDGGLSPWKARSKHEETSRLIEAAVSYCCNKATAEPGFIADHTCDGVFAGCAGIVGDRYSRGAARSLRKLVKLMGAADNLMTVELWSLASVASFVLKQTDEFGGELQDDEIGFLKSFSRLVERLCKDQYHRELRAVRS